MSPRKRHGNEKPSTDILESGALPPELEDAQAEYFADMAFDERLHILLEAEPKNIKIEAIGVSKDLTGEGFFVPNTYSHELIQLEEGGVVTELPIEALSFRANGTIIEQTGKLEVDIRIDSDSDPQPPMYIKTDKDNRDSFLVYRAGIIEEIERISTPMLAQLTMMVCDLDSTARKQLRVALGETAPAYRSIITQLWKNLSERSGEMTQSITLVEDMPESTKEIPVRAKLAYITQETPSQSTITMILQQITEFPELDSRDIYTLRLVYADSGHTNLEKDAKRIISSGLESVPEQSILREIEMSHTTNDGRPQKLDIHDPVIQQLFVDAFDQIVAG